MKAKGKRRPARASTKLRSLGTAKKIAGRARKGRRARLRSTGDATKVVSRGRPARRSGG